MPATRSANVTAYTVTTASAQAVPARTRNYLAIINQSAGTIAFNLGGTAVVGGAGSVNLAAAPGPGNMMVWDGAGALVPNNAVNIIGGSAGTATIIE